MRLEEIMEKLNPERMERGQAYHDYRRESIEWMNARGGALNAFAGLAFRKHRGLLPAAQTDGVSEFFADSLKVWVLGDDRGAIKARPDVRVFLGRAAGYRGPGQSVRTCSPRANYGPGAAPANSPVRRHRGEPGPLGPTLGLDNA